MRKLIIFTMLFTATAAWTAGIPAQITYQGTLKQTGAPANGTKTMFFRITSQDGTQVYWSSGNKSVTVSNGLFATQLAPSGVDWQNVTPYIEVSIEGQVLLPREPVAATVYAQMSQSIVDGAVTSAKVAPGFGLVPSGAIMMFASLPCPNGWQEFTDLKGKFPAGEDPGNQAQFTVGEGGGSLTHTHTITVDGAHNHGGKTGVGDTPATYLPDPNGAGQYATHRHPISMDGAHSHGGATGATSTLPPYLTLVFCQKQ
jgi:hypothetical protein